ncbi:MAG TPA: flavin reductase family protein [Trebonia sp.]|nr:flavin reductase family protein [Trebonia sp.]
MRDQVFRDLMAAVCAPVTVVTSADEAGPHGATVSAFASLSLRPPLVTVALDRRSALLARVLAAGRLGVNVLGSADDDVARQFAGSGTDRFAGVPWTADHGLPRLGCAAGWAVCHVRQVVDGGDHLLLIAEVVHAESRQAAPLVYGHRTFGTHSGFAHRPVRPIEDAIAACARL